MRKAVFAGTFDPFTVGHLDLVKRAAGIFDEIVVAVAGDGSQKSCKATIAQRVEIAKKSVRGIDGVSVCAFDGLLTDFAKKEHISCLVRGIRNVADFEYEKNLAAVYKSLDDSLEIVYLIASPDCGFVSSSFVRDLLSLKGDVDAYISKEATNLVKEIYC